MIHSCTLVDDDGVLVISTVRQMLFWKDHGFEYDFPEELLGHMREGRIVAWDSGQEGEHLVSISLDATERQSSSSGPFLLRILEDDEFVIMPYSQFTYAADCADGEIEDKGRLSYRFGMPAGNYHVFISKLSEERWRITLEASVQEISPDFADDLPRPKIARTDRWT